MVTTVPVDRRAAQKARQRRAILDAADALILERGGPRFGVDELAVRADVSRRTVFNYFASLDDVVLTVATEALDEAIDAFSSATAATPVGTGTRAEMFDEIERILRAAALPRAVVYLFRALGGMEESARSRQRQFALGAFDRVAQHLTDELSRRNPGADALDVTLLVTSLVHGLGAIAEHWIGTTDVSGPDALAAWDRLLDRLVDSVRTGYMPER